MQRARSYLVGHILPSTSSPETGAVCWPFRPKGEAQSFYNSISLPRVRNKPEISPRRGSLFIFYRSRGLGERERDREMCTETHTLLNHSHSSSFLPPATNRLLLNEEEESSQETMNNARAQQRPRVSEDSPSEQDRTSSTSTPDDSTGKLPQRNPAKSFISSSLAGSCSFAATPPSSEKATGDDSNTTSKSRMVSSPASAAAANKTMITHQDHLALHDCPENTARRGIGMPPPSPEIRQRRRSSLPRPPSPSVTDDRCEAYYGIEPKSAGSPPRGPRRSLSSAPDSPGYLRASSEGSVYDFTRTGCSAGTADNTSAVHVVRQRRSQSFEIVGERNDSFFGKKNIAKKLSAMYLLLVVLILFRMAWTAARLMLLEGTMP
jgi:hypothetical protein